MTEGTEGIGGAARPRAWSISAELMALLVIVALAALLRLPDLPLRGTWDSDQGHDMLVLRALVRDGALPLLGPPTSIGDFHHGALYYYLLSPAAFVSGGSVPHHVVGWIAFQGIAAVAVVWWLARSIGESVAGAAAALLMAISTSAVDESTFIWNPNPIPLWAALALATAWRAWTTGRVRWWLVAAATTAMTMQLHVLAVLFLPVVAALLVADARRRTGSDRRRVLLAGLAGLGIIAVAYVPLVVHELTTDFSETRAALDWLTGEREPSRFDPVTRLLIVGVRVLTWPIVGLISDAGAVALLGAVLVVGIVVWRWRSADRAERVAVRWLGLGLLWSSVSLSFAATSLATVARGLPNDHYHAFADPMVFVLMGLGAAAAVRLEVPRPGLRTRLRAAGAAGAGGAVGAALVLGGLVAWNVTRLPPVPNPDGGFPAMQAAAQRTVSVLGERSFAFASLPDFKSTENLEYPLLLEGLAPVPAAEADALVLVCDGLFEAAIGAACGGAAEDAAVPPSTRFVELVDRFEAQPETWISVYVAAAAVGE